MLEFESYESKVMVIKTVFKFFQLKKLESADLKKFGFQLVIDLKRWCENTGFEHFKYSNANDTKTRRAREKQ